jgi:Pili and flagellar-assembly chaperone, PapD N-terminal domain
VDARAANSANDQQAGDFGGGPAEWPSWYAQYLVRATEQSAKTLALYQQVLECVSRGELAPTALQELLPRFVQARSTAYTGRLTELTSRFFSELLQVGSAYSKELAGLLMPGTTVPEVPLPPLDPADPMKWLQQLGEYAGQLNARAMKAYQSHLDRVTAGQATPQQMQQATADYLQNRLPAHLRRIGQLYFELLNDLNAVRAEHEVEYLTGVLATASGPGKDPITLNLSGPLGTAASGSIALANTKDERVLIRCSVTDVRRANGVGPAFAPKLAITPDAVELDPGQEISVRVTIQLDEADYDRDALYVGTLHVIRHGEPRLEIPLRITATEPAHPAAEQKG